MAPIKNMLAVLVAGTIVAGCNTTETQKDVVVDDASVLATYVDIAQAKYEDSLTTAQALNTSITEFLAAPTEASLDVAKAAWVAARVPYQQTEVYRFGNVSVDDWEGKVNAWPLDEGLIDYVASAYGTESDENGFYTANIIANPTLKVGGVTVDATTIDKALLSETLHEIDEIESNVATGYHVIEFLLWGQDLNGTKPGAGARPATDYSLENCTGGNCDRRRAYLQAATQLMIDDLQEMADNWKEGGASQQELAAKGAKGGLATILTGMGSLAYGELAGERIKLGLMLHDPEEEHDCFSDNTHWSHFYDAKGIKNVYLGEYTRVDGSVVAGQSLSDLVKSTDAALDADMKEKLTVTENAMQAMVDEAEKGRTFDVLIGADEAAGNQVIQNVVDALVAQAKTTEKIIVALKLGSIELEGSDSLDNPSSIVQ